jgi:hypothetical protein
MKVIFFLLFFSTWEQQSLLPSFRRPTLRGKVNKADGEKVDSIARQASKRKKIK